MKITSLIPAVLVALALCTNVQAAIYIGGHADIGVGYEDEPGEDPGLHLHFHVEEGMISFFDGSELGIGEYDANAFMVGVPGPPESRPAGSNWDFLAANENDSYWFLPQGEDFAKPYLGMGTEELLPEAGWSTVDWQFNSITPISGDLSAFSLYQVGSNGQPTFVASTIDDGEDTWTQPAENHAHYNFAFTGEGIYEVEFTVSAFNDGNGNAGIAEGTYTDTATFTFVTGSAVPEPGSLSIVTLLAAGAFLRRRR